jgi:hypothetical protein
MTRFLEKQLVQRFGELAYHGANIAAWRLTATAIATPTQASSRTSG